MSEEEIQPEETPEEFGGDDQADQPEPTPETEEVTGEDEVSDEPVQADKSVAQASTVPTHTPPRPLAPIATSTPRSIKIKVQHEAGQLKNIILEDDQLGQATMDFSDISRTGFSGTGLSQSLTVPDDLLQVSVTNLSSSEKSPLCPANNGANCECVEKSVPKFTRQPKQLPTDEDTSLMLRSALGTSLLHCERVLELPPPVRSSTPITNQSLAAQYTRPMAQAPPEPYSFQTTARAGPSNVSGIQNAPHPQTFGSPNQGTTQAYQFWGPGQPVNISGIAPLSQSGSPCSPPNQDRRPCPGGQMNQRSPQPLAHYGGGYADSSVYLQSSLDHGQTREYNLPRYQDHGNNSSLMAAPPRSQYQGQGSRMNRSMPLGPVSSGKHCPDKPKCPPISQTDCTLQQLETTNNRLMHLGRQVVDMRAELQPSGGCHEKSPCGDNRKPNVIICGKADDGIPKIILTYT